LNRMTTIERNDIVEFTYINWRGKEGTRTVRVEGFYWGFSEYHEGAQLFLKGLDTAKLEERSFAVKDILEICNIIGHYKEEKKR
jgi:hypothetical protein